MQRHVILFARTPRYGRVKTRLAKDIGQNETLRFYRNTLSTVSQRLTGHGKFNFSIALTPDTGLVNECSPILGRQPLRAQGSGDLGKRMTSAFASLPPGPALIIGSDIPDIHPHHLEVAFRKLGENDAVFGPCDDGGYWLVGLKRRQGLAPDFMRHVRWSSCHALKDTLATLPKHWKVAYINKLDDIDDGAAYMEWAKRLTVMRQGARQ